MRIVAALRSRAGLDLRRQGYLASLSLQERRVVLQWHSERARRIISDAGLSTLDSSAITFVCKAAFRAFRTCVLAGVEEPDSPHWNRFFADFVIRWASVAQPRHDDGCDFHPVASQKYSN
jgi:hypothetical protein